jgi:hypothetical protein
VEAGKQDPEREGETMSKKSEVLKKFPAPWHLEGPHDLDGICWGNDIAIVAANGECILNQWSKDSDWPMLAEYFVRQANKEAGFPDAPLRLPKHKRPKERMLKSAGGTI